MLLLLLLPSLTLASIKVSMKGVIYNEDGKYNIVGTGNQKGFDQQVIKTADLATLDIGNEQLKSMIEKVNEEKPDEVLVNDDYDWGNVYSWKRWKHVQRKIEPDLDNYNLDFKQEKVVLTNTNYDNPSDKRKTVLVTESRIVNSHVMSVWTKPMVKSINMKVKLNFKVENDYIVDLKERFPSGENYASVKTENFVQNHTINLLPNQSVKARLEATKGTITVVIPYKVKLSGDVVAKYPNKLQYKNKFYQKFDINQLLEGNQRNSTITAYQTVLFEFHYNSQLHIIGTDDTVLRTFTEAHATRKDDAAKKEFETADGVKLRIKLIPAEFLELIHKAVVEKTAEENMETL